MIRELFSKLTVLPRAAVILIDQILIVVSVGLAFLLRFNFNIAEIRNFDPAMATALCLASAIIATTVTKSYAGIVRYTGIQDGLRIVGTELLTLALVIVFNLAYYYNFQRNIIPYSVVFISFFISSLLLYQNRFLVKNIFSFIKSDKKDSKPVVILGA
ncbi:MAG: polysaccharide biosynthesis protein, partial [Chryseolinea sp.]